MKYFAPPKQSYQWLYLSLSMALSCRTAHIRRDSDDGPVRVRTVSASFSSETSADFVVRLGVNNSNRREGVATRLDWELWIQGRWFGSGRLAMHQPLRALGESEFDVVLPLAFRRVPDSKEPIDLSTGIRGTLYAQVGHSEERWPFQRILIIRGQPIFSSEDAE